MAAYLPELPRRGDEGLVQEGNGFQGQPYSLSPCALHPCSPANLGRSPEHCQSPVGLREVSSSGSDEVQTTLILKLQFVIQFKAPLSFPSSGPRRLSSPKLGEGGCSSLRVPPPLTPTGGLQPGGEEKGKAKLA